MSTSENNQPQEQSDLPKTPAGQRHSIEDVEMLLQDVQKGDVIDISGETGAKLISVLEQYLAIIQSGTDWKNGYIVAYTEIVGFLSVIFRNLWIIILVSIIGGTTAFFVVDMQTRIFETQTALVILPNNENGTVPKPIDSVDIALGTYIQVLRSHEFADEVSLRLADSYSSSAMRNVSVVVRPVENSTVIVITVQATSPELAKSYADQMAYLISQENPLPSFKVYYPVSVLDAAYLPLTPSFPEVKKTIALATLGSLIVGVLVAFLRDTYIRKS